MDCVDCGIPRGVGRANAWKPCGIIVSRYEPDLRGILYEVGELDNLFASLSGRIGYDVTRLVREGKRKDARHYVRGLLGHLRERGVEMPPPEEFLRAMAANFSVPGFGKAAISDYREGESITLEVEGVYNLPMALGQAAGVYEAVLGRRAEVSWEGGAERGRIRLTAAEPEPELEERIESGVEAAAPIVEEGEREYRLCPRCSAPLELSQGFEWDGERALILERSTGRRHVFDNVRGVAAVMRALVDELGEEVEALLADISRAYARDYYRARGKNVVLADEMAGFSLRGWGLPVDLRAEGEGWSLRVINPFYPPLVAGRVWGLLEVQGGKELDLEDHRASEGIAHLAFRPS